MNKFYIIFLAALYLNLCVDANAQAIINEKIESKTTVNEKSIEAFCKLASSLNVPIDDLLNRKDQYLWNDWIFYKVVEEIANENFPEKDLNFKILFVWHVLNKANYDVRLFYGDQFSIWVKSNESLGNLRSRLINNVQYICTNLVKGNGIVYESKVSCTTRGSSTFSFVIDRSPNFPNNKIDNYEQVFYDSVIHNKFLDIQLCANDRYLDMLYTYPNISLKNLVRLPLSKDVHDCLKENLFSLMSGADDISKIKFLYQYVRGAIFDIEEMDDDLESKFAYKEKWMTPEETISTAFVDSRAKSVLLSYLIKEIADVPIVIVSYENGRFNIGVSLETYGIKGDFKHEGLSYVVCDPSVFTERFGDNKLYQTKKYRIAAKL